MDHIIPLRFGGKVTALENLQALCRPCHEVKSARESSMASATKFGPRVTRDGTPAQRIKEFMQ